MGKKALSGRENWQTESGPGGLAGTAEKNLYVAFRKAFEGTDYVISDHPTDLNHIMCRTLVSHQHIMYIFTQRNKIIDAEIFWISIKMKTMQIIKLFYRQACSSKIESSKAITHFIKCRDCFRC